MTRVIHTADTHIGYRQYHSPERRRDFLEAFQRVVEDAVEEDVDAVVHAGDVFHDRRPDLPDLLGTIDALRELAAADIPFLAIVGNHEDKREAQWLDLFERLDLATRLDGEGTIVGDVTVYGLDYVPRSRRDEVDISLAEPDTDHAALVAHGLFEPFAHAEWDTESFLERAGVDVDAHQLGDNHHPDTAEVGDTWVTYAGSTERVSADEEGDRGYNVVTFDEGVEVARRGLPTRPFRFVDIELRDGEGVERVRERVREHDLADAVVYVRVAGAGEPFAPATVEEFATERGALVARVNDRREIEAAEEDLEISFADPDEAVRERVREMGLSGAALAVDEAVRESGLADTNVRDAVRERVEGLLEEDPGSFEPAAGDTSADRAATPDGDAAAGDEAMVTDETGAVKASDRADEPGVADGSGEAETERESDGPAGTKEPDEADESGEASKIDEASEPEGAEEGQASVEDFL